MLYIIYNIHKRGMIICDEYITGEGIYHVRKNGKKKKRV